MGGNKLRLIHAQKKKTEKIEKQTIQKTDNRSVKQKDAENVNLIGGKQAKAGPCPEFRNPDREFIYHGKEKK